MSMNSVYGYSYNPYAYNNAYMNSTNFQGSTTNSTQKEEGNALGTIAAIGAGVAAVGTAIYAVKKGKSINGADSSIFKNLKTGLSEIGKTITKKIGSIFGKKSNANEDLTKAAEEIIKTSKAPYSNEAFNNAVTNYKDIIIEKGNKIWEEISSPTYRVNYDQFLGR